MFPSKLDRGAVSAAQQRAQDFRMRLSLMEQETGGCRHCGDPVVSANRGGGGRIYLEVGSGWTIEVYTTWAGRRDLLAYESRTGNWRKHECRSRGAA